MPYRDLRDYIGELSRRGLLQIVDEKVCKDTELVPLVRLQFRGLPEPQRKAFWFRNVSDARGREFDASVVLGALGSSRAIYAAALSTEPDKIADAWARAHGNHLKPRVVARADDVGNAAVKAESGSGHFCRHDLRPERKQRWCRSAPESGADGDAPGCCRRVGDNSGEIDEHTGQEEIDPAHHGSQSNEIADPGEQELSAQHEDEGE